MLTLCDALRVQAYAPHCCLADWGHQPHRENTCMQKQTHVFQSLSINNGITKGSLQSQP